jgi:CelD/BcsL family acetyltransferase involved in cellulose biosynthesis
LAQALLYYIRFFVDNLCERSRGRPKEQAMTSATNDLAGTRSLNDVTRLSASSDVNQVSSGATTLGNTAIHSLDPLRDPRWRDLTEKHPGASVFHTPGWLEALRRTYGYEPVAYTTAAPGTDLTNGVVLCRVRSLVTGRRLVSLPFSDHCEPLTERPEDLPSLLHFLEVKRTEEKWAYVEMRPRTCDAAPLLGMEPSLRYVFHTIDLGPRLEHILRRFHKDSTQRKIRRAEREKLTYEEGRGDALVEKFYPLLLRTRRRQQLPPHPRAWFRNLTESLGDKVKIRVASRNGRPIASILTLIHKDVMVYKYGCSDERFHNLGGMHLLFWTAIQEAKHSGCREFDLGRSDADNPGLITFKEHWGAARSQLTYWRNPAPRLPMATVVLARRLIKFACAHAPNRLLIAAGDIFYRHVG